MVLGERELTVARVEEIARRGAPVRVAASARRAVARAHAVLVELAAQGEPIYGLNRGVGFFKDRTVSPRTLRAFNRSLLLSHLGGVGPHAEPEEVRAMMAVRMGTLLRGHAGCSPALVDAYAAFLNHGIHPLVPLRGSVGEADITCLAYIGLAFLGEGRVLFGGRKVPAAEALAACGLAPLELGPKDALAIVSSNALSAGIGCLVVGRIRELLDAADLVYALSLEGIQGHLSPLDPAVHAARPFAGQAASAAAIRGHLEGSYLHDGSPASSLQDPLSYRTASHVHGAARDALGFLEAQLAIHLNSSEDNPCVLPDEERVVPSGNFDPLAWVLGFEAVAVALCHVSKLACRRMLRITDPRFSGLPQYLAPSREAGFGFSEIQKTFASLQAEVRHLAMPGSLDDLSLAGDLEDHAVNAPFVVRKTRDLVDAVTWILGIEALHAARALELRPRARLGAGTRRAFRLLRETLSFVSTDRNLTPDIARCQRLVRDGMLVDAARSRRRT